MAHIQDFQRMVSKAVDVVEFKLVRSISDLENDELAFHPLMAHQIFGESESIFGYEGLKVRILYTAGPLHIHLAIEYERRVDELSKGNIKADDIVATVAAKLPDGCCFVNMDDFLRTLATVQRFQPFEEKMNQYTAKDRDNKLRTFEIYQSDFRQPLFLKFFSRLQSFVLWFVDAASYIDVDDPQWKFFICYEKYKNDDGEDSYVAVGYTTVYQYYAYPENMRPRISQMLVLPPYQNLGIGTTFLQGIYKHYQNLRSVKDITVEDPSEDFQRMRNFIDCCFCKELKAFQNEELKRGLTKEMLKEARDAFKINQHQCRRIYEILRLLHTNKQDEAEYKAYRLEIKKRLNAVYYKQLKDIKKLEKAKIDTELLRARLPDAKLRIEQLQEEYEQVEKEYEHIIDKMRKSS